MIQARLLAQYVPKFRAEHRDASLCARNDLESTGASSFLRGEPASQALGPIRPVAHLVELLLNETARDQRIAWIVDPAPHLGHVHQIDPVPDDTHIRRLSLPSRP